MTASSCLYMEGRPWAPQGYIQALPCIKEKHLHCTLVKNGQGDFVTTGREQSLRRVMGFGGAFPINWLSRSLCQNWA